jgi:hypothetical protein
MADEKESSSPEKRDGEAEKKPWWSTVIGQITTPLAYFALIVVCICVCLPVISNLSCTPEEKYHLCLWLFGLMAFMVLIVAGIAFVRPNHLFKAERQQVEQKLDELTGFVSTEAFSDSVISVLRSDTDAVLEYVTSPALDEAVSRKVDERFRSLGFEDLKQLKEDNEEKQSGS